MARGRKTKGSACNGNGELWQMADAFREQQTEAAKLDTAIAANLKELGYGS